MWDGPLVQFRQYNTGANLTREMTDQFTQAIAGRS